MQPYSHEADQLASKLPSLLPLTDCIVRLRCSLGGWDVYNKPVGTLTEEDLRTAMRRLAQYDVVIPLEQFDVHAPWQLSAVLGWQDTELPVANANDEPDESVESTAIGSFSTEDMVALASVNRLDSTLYAYALRLARKLTQKSKPATIITRRTCKKTCHDEPWWPLTSYNRNATRIAPVSRAR